jgi:hypothetical protein
VLESAVAALGKLAAVARIAPAATTNPITAITLCILERETSLAPNILFGAKAGQYLATERSNVPRSGAERQR